MKKDLEEKKEGYDYPKPEKAFTLPAWILLKIPALKQFY